MSGRSVITFPCPSCDQMISLSGKQAVGPCPHCQTEIQALFNAAVVTRLIDHSGPSEKGYDARCFRPDGRSQESDWRSHTPQAK
ncbi:hypothetical protein N9F61_01315 [Akkermansiaceae bacterium]|nr:hypothetical protein [Akkermansiaceae bacterium]MDB4287015.1 hypothetical protein [Akkermansiaceae bacterium]